MRGRRDDDYQWQEACGNQGDAFTCERIQCELSEWQDHHCPFCEHFYDHLGEWAETYNALECYTASGDFYDHIHRECNTFFTEKIEK